MDQIIQFLNGFNVQTIVSMTCILWLFFNHFENRVDSKIEKLDARMEQQSARTDKLYEMFIELVRNKKD